MAGEHGQDLDALYRAYAPVVHRRARKLLGNEADALDAVQDIFMSLERKLGGFRGQASLMTWIYRVTTNHCLNVLRSQHSRDRAYVGAAPLEVTTDGPDAAMATHDLLTRLTHTLSERQLEALVHLYVDELPQAEVAELMGISDRAVRKLVAHARERAGAELTRLEATNTKAPGNPGREGKR